MRKVILSVIDFLIKILETITKWLEIVKKRLGQNLLDSRASKSCSRPVSTPNQSSIAEYVEKFQRQAICFYVHLSPDVIGLNVNITTSLFQKYPKTLSKPVVDINDIEKEYELTYRDAITGIKEWLRTEKFSFGEGDSVRDVLSELLHSRAREKATEIVKDHVARSQSTVQ